MKVFVESKNVRVQHVGGCVLEVSDFIVWYSIKYRQWVTLFEC